MPEAPEAADRARAVRAAVVVAHPDDETLWAGGTMLTRPEWDFFVGCLCRGSDPDRAPKFRRALDALGAAGRIGDLDDAPEQAPLPDADVQTAVLSLLPGRRFDLVLTHGPWGEYTRHRRHEETCKAVISLWRAGQLTARGLWLFAYEDSGGRRLPCARSDAHVKQALPSEIWQRKYAIIRDVYGFSPESFEARSAPREEAFWCFESPEAFGAWIDRRR